MKIYLVGCMNVPIKDKDYVVVGATEAEFLNKGFHKLSKKDISVFLDPISKNEYALARKEDKYDLKNKIVNFSYKDVSLVEDLYRRDFTINAMALDEETNEIIDPFNGKIDIQNKVLKHVSERFEEDPLRILRGYRFAVNYGFKFNPDTMQLFKTMIQRGDLKYVANGRVVLELLKCGNKIKEFVLKLDGDGFLQNFFPKSKIFTNDISSPEELLISLYYDSSMGKELRDLFIHYGFDKKAVDRLITMNAYTNLFDLLIKDLRIDHSSSNLKSLLYYFNLKSPYLSEKIKVFKKALSKETYSYEKSTFEGKALGKQILLKKKQIFNNIF
jgi:tRNA nucleotidyltransferase/poly(A) polymerase